MNGAPLPDHNHRPQSDGKKTKQRSPCPRRDRVSACNGSADRDATDGERPVQKRDALVRHTGEDETLIQMAPVRGEEVFATARAS